MEQQEALAGIEIKAGELHCTGLWTVQGIAMLNLADIQSNLKSDPKQKNLAINGTAIEIIDTAGFFLLQQLVQQLEKQGYKLIWQGFNEQQEELLALITKKSVDLEIPVPPPAPGFIEKAGRGTVEFLLLSRDLLAFIGEIVIVFGRSLLHPRKLRWRALFNVVESAGCRAAFIIALLSFLIGMVLVYQMGLQLSNYGANIFVTDILGVSLLREFSPLITAIIVAGRTGSAFTAQIGTMKVNEEIDAIRTFGLSPTELLLLPRMMALILVLPLLTVVSELFGVFGGMLVSKSMLNISYAEFLDRFQAVIPLKTYLLGMIKVPIFAAIIATVGCFQGLKVSGSAESVGQRTTTSVVHSIFLIIVTDAVISVLYSWYGL